jgi:hypothetical protein
VSRGVSPLAYWGIFSISETKRQENALISYGYFQIAPWEAAAIKLSAAIELLVSREITFGSHKAIESYPRLINDSTVSFS